MNQRATRLLGLQGHISHLYGLLVFPLQDVQRLWHTDCDVLHEPDGHGLAGLSFLGRKADIPETVVGF